jgi:hypothetical protein
LKYDGCPICTGWYGKFCIYTNAKNQIPTQQIFYQQASSQPPNSHLQPTQPTLQHHSTPNTTGPDEIYTGNPEQPKAKDSPLPQDNRAQYVRAGMENVVVD